MLRRIVGNRLIRSELAAHFIPQLALPKRFATARAEALLGRAAPPVRAFWGRMIDHLQATGWRGAAGLTEVAA